MKHLVEYFKVTPRRPARTILRLEALEDRTLPAVSANFAQALVRTSAPANEQTVPDVGVANNGDFVVVWQHRTADASPTDFDIYYRRYSADGSPKDATERLAEGSGFDESVPRVAVNPDGSFVIAFVRANTGTAFTGIYFDRFDAAGNRLNPTPTLASTGAGEDGRNQSQPDIAGFDDGRFVIAWADDFTTDRDVVFAQLNADGSLKAGPAAVSSSAAVDEFDPSVDVRPGSYPADELAIVVSYTTNSADADVGYKGYAEGSLVTPLFGNTANTTADLNQDQSSVGMDAAGNFVIAWSSDAAVGDRDVYARQLDKTGAATTAEAGVVASAGDQHDPAVARADDGRFLIAYQDDSFPATRVRYQEYASAANAFSAVGIAQDYASHNSTQSSPALAASFTGNFALAADDSFSNTAGGSDPWVRTYQDSVVLISDVALPEGDSGFTPFTFTISLTKASTQTITITYQTADGTAAAPADYTALPTTTVVFSPGETSKAVTVQVKGDTIREAAEPFFLELGGVSNSILSRPHGVGTILNDEPIDQVGLSVQNRFTLDTNANHVLDLGDLPSFSYGAAGDIPLVGDFNGDGRADVGVWRGGTFTLDSNGNHVLDAGDRVISFGRATDTPVVGDWNGDGRADVGVRRGGTFILDSNGDGVYKARDRVIRYGRATDRPVVGDWNGDGRTDVGVRRGGTFILDSNGNRVYGAADRVIRYGAATDRPVVGDWNGDVRDDVGVWRDGTFILDSNGNFRLDAGRDVSFTYGLATDVLVIGDWNGDFRAEVGVWRNGQLFLDSDGNHVYQTGDPTFLFGDVTDTSLYGDWNGDGRTEAGVWRNGTFILDSNGNQFIDAGDVTATFGNATDTPVVGDFNGDGVTDLGVWRGGTFILDSNGNHFIDAGDVTATFGNATDTPVVGDFNGDGVTDIGVWRNGAFLLDSNGNHAIDPGDASFNFGSPGDVPVVGDFNGDGRADVGIYRNNAFFLDANGNRRFDAGDVFFSYGSAVGRPLTGRW